MASIRVLNLNIWDLPYSKDLSLRIPQICRVLDQNDCNFANGGDRGYDIIGFQEAFMERDRAQLIAAAKRGGINYAHFFDSGMGFPAYPENGHPSGLLILSRFPIVQVAFLRYSLNGKPHKLLHWDWHIGKGCGLARISTPFGLVDVYLSHFVASYIDSPDSPDEYLVDRVTQAYECAEFIQMSRRAPLAMLLCDLNSIPDSLPYKLLSQLSGLADAFSVANPHLDPQDGRTCNINRYADGFARRVDFVFYSTQPLPFLPDDPAEAARRMDEFAADTCAEMQRAVQLAQTKPNNEAVAWDVNRSCVTLTDSYPVEEEHYAPGKQPLGSRLWGKLSTFLSALSVASYSGQNAMAFAENAPYLRDTPSYQAHQARTAAIRGMRLASQNNREPASESLFSPNDSTVSLSPTSSITLPPNPPPTITTSTSSSPRPEPSQRLPEPSDDEMSDTGRPLVSHISTGGQNGYQPITTTMTHDEEAALSSSVPSEMETERMVHLSDHAGVEVVFRVDWERKEPPKTPPAKARKWSSVGHPLDLELSEGQKDVLRAACSVLEGGLSDAAKRQHEHRRFMDLGILLAFILVIGAYNSLLSPWALVVLLPLLTVHSLVQFFIHSMFGNEELAALHAVWRAVMIRLQSGHLVMHSYPPRSSFSSGFSLFGPHSPLSSPNALIKNLMTTSRPGSGNLSRGGLASTSPQLRAPTVAPLTGSGSRGSRGASSSSIGGRRSRANSREQGPLPMQRPQGLTRGGGSVYTPTMRPMPSIPIYPEEEDLGRLPEPSLVHSSFGKAVTMQNGSQSVAIELGENRIRSPQLSKGDEKAD